jgi:hypothetical protein
MLRQAKLVHKDPELATLALAENLDHPFSVAFIKLHTTIASHALRKPEEVQSRAEETIKLSTEYGFASTEPSALS